MGKPGKVRNIVFVAVAAACLLTVVVYKAAVLLTPLEDEVSSTLEGRVYQNLPELTWEAFESGEYQDDFEQFVDDSVPGHDAALLANAALQQCAITIANIPFGFDARPTFYGSDYVYMASIGAIWGMPEDAPSEEEMADWAEACSEVIETDSGIDWVFYLCDGTAVTAANPVLSLTSADASGYSYLEDGFLDLLPESCTIVDGSYTSTEEYVEDHFLTDHHWNIRGALRAYDSVIEALGKEPVEFGEVYVAYEGPFWGSYARRGLSILGEGDVILDVEYERSSLRVTVDGVEQYASYLDESFAADYTSYTKSSMFADCYGSYFHGDPGLIEIENLDVQNGESLLIIGDSYTNCMERFFAESYQYVYIIDPRNYEEGTIQEFLDGHDIDDGVFICQYALLQNVESLL